MINARLYNEIEIVHLIYAKFRNQQRTQTWWKFFAILHRRLLRFVQNNAVDSSSAQFIVDKLVPRAARAFHTILTQGAFVTIGFALLASIARLRTLLLPYCSKLSKNKNTKKSQCNKSLQNLAIHDFTEEDLGEDLENDDSWTDSKPLVEKSVLKSKDKRIPGGKYISELPKKKKKSKKKGSNVIDDIFG